MGGARIWSYDLLYAELGVCHWAMAPSTCIRVFSIWKRLLVKHLQIHRQCFTKLKCKEPFLHCLFPLDSSASGLPLHQPSWGRKKATILITIRFGFSPCLFTLYVLPKPALVGTDQPAFRYTYQTSRKAIMKSKWKSVHLQCLSPQHVCLHNPCSITIKLLLSKTLDWVQNSALV